jgi:hypothetical protein
MRGDPLARQWRIIRAIEASPGGLTVAEIGNRQPFQREPDFGVTSVNYDFAELLARAEAPR